MTASLSPHSKGGTPAYPRRLLRIPSACAAADVSRSTIYRAINAGQLDVVKVGTATAITVESFERWIAGLPKLDKNAA
jgi:excisionase family DNA binding protein